MSYRLGAIGIVISVSVGCTEQARMSVRAERGDPKAMYDYGDYMIRKRPNNPYSDWDEGSAWILKAAEAGYPKAMWRMGSLSVVGSSPDKDPKVRYWYIKAAEAGNINAMGELGIAYRFGNYGFQKDSEKSKYWFDRAAIEKVKRPNWQIE